MSRYTLWWISGNTGDMVNKISKRPSNQWIFERWVLILHVTLCTVVALWRGTHQVGIQHWRSAEVTSCIREVFGANCNLFWCIRRSWLLCLSQYELRTLLHLTSGLIFEKSVNSVDLTDHHVSSERQLWESMIYNSISVLYLRNSLISLCTFPAGSADLDSGVSTSSLLRIGRHAISDPNFQKSIDFIDPDSCVVSCWKTSFSKDKTLFLKSSLNNCFLFQDVLSQRRLRIR